jgi:gluconokinase
MDGLAETPYGAANPGHDGHVVLVMGVSGCGKTTVGRLLADRLGWPFLDADDLHPPANVAKMAAGIPLTDADREPWLATVAEWIAERRSHGEPGVVACSALKRIYRDGLRGADEGIRLVYLKGERELLEQRLAHRHGHFFPQRLLAAQLADLEEPTDDEKPIIVPIGLTPADIADIIVAALTG